MFGREGFAEPRCAVRGFRGAALRRARVSRSRAAPCEGGAASGGVPETSAGLEGGAQAGGGGGGRGRGGGGGTADPRPRGGGPRRAGAARPPRSQAPPGRRRPAIRPPP